MSPTFNLGQPPAVRSQPAAMGHSERKGRRASVRGVWPHVVTIPMLACVFAVQMGDAGSNELPIESLDSLQSALPEICKVPPTSSCVRMCCIREACRLSHSSCKHASHAERPLRSRLMGWNSKSLGVP
jgi:hypothetical protein